jgi:hypothetical protein
MAMMASKGAVEAAFLGAETESCVRSEAEPRRSAAAPTTPVDEDCTWEAE